jgi:uncharacterized protein YjbI with pentapeptide repeats
MEKVTGGNVDTRGRKFAMLPKNDIEQKNAHNGHPLSAKRKNGHSRPVAPSIIAKIEHLKTELETLHTSLQPEDGAEDQSLSQKRQEQIALNWANDGRKASLSGFDLEWANLRTIDLAGATLDMANLHEADLRKVDLSGANLKGTKLTWTDLSGANLKEASLNWADLRGANLYNAKLKEADLRGANLENANLVLADLRGVKIDDTTQVNDKWRLVWEIVNNDIQGRDLSKTDLRGANLRKSHLEESDLKGADLTGANLEEACLSQANLYKANLARSNLRKADLYKTNLEESNLREANLEGVSLDKANLYGADLSEASLHEADLGGANLKGVNLHGADLSGVNLFGLDLEEVDSEDDLSEDTPLTNQLANNKASDGNLQTVKNASTSDTKTNGKRKMEQEEKFDGSSEQVNGARTSFLWFVWGVSLSITTICSIVLLALVIVSVAINAYLGWELAGFEVVIRKPQVSGVAPVPPPNPVAVATPTPVVNTPVPPPPETQINTPVVVAPDTSEPPSTAVAVAMNTPELESVISPTAPPVNSAPPTAVPPPTAEAAGDVQSFAPPTTSSNRYDLITIKGGRESRPAAEHGDLNLKLRDPQPIDVELSLIDIPGSGIDADTPKLSAAFEPNFVNAYTVHNWDWACNCKGELLREDQLVLVGIKTRPGEPIFIPSKKQDIFAGKYFATVLYASEDSLTFIYDNVGNVTTGYTVHYLGLQTDPNLLTLFRESKGNELPGLTLDTPVGTATDELIIAIRDKGTFMDARSRKDWWD